MSCMWAAARSVAVGAALAVPVFVTVHERVGFVYKVSGKSMLPTLSSDVVWVSSIALHSKPLDLGVVVAFWCPNDRKNRMIKRVVAIEQERIRSRNYKQRVVRVPAGHSWVEGDNPAVSRDSNLFGPISNGLVFGVATHVVWPPSRWGRVRTELLPSQEQRRRDILQDVQ